ncbi:ImmA/IrrE family metallo-endopeptidase [Chitinophaga filiformis]|uniref:ImmA/IrrE family metallo-endopeptidase n=1 Tax=Chitinophaga filiformis TaxID=104663 RepID=A0ABY4HZM6_CHIFI|nr:ImmA/IrrE family metallo-endopeptidase [Chitinophaga filiformis]UPK67946.1 ImmA/IrrE family metallo-endopeptidase [Chitinophaga filiformis]
MVLERIEHLATDIIKRTGATTLPIDVEAIARALNIRVAPFPMDNAVSGVLLIDSNGVPTIGYNITESRVRRRFTLAHEIGHYICHVKQGDGSRVFVDKDFKVMFRSKSPEPGEIRMEREANAFAASLLMPEFLLLEMVTDKEFDLNSEDSIRELAKTFDVSVGAMSFRLLNLGMSASYYNNQFF